MTKFINPYNFVPADPARIDAQRQEPVGFQHRFADNRMSGRLHCTLTTKTCVFVPDSASGGQNQQKRFHRQSGQSDGLLTIPGSSLKGVLRTVAEAISNSCFTVFAEEGYKYRLLNPSLEEKLCRGAWTSPASGTKYELKSNRDGRPAITFSHTPLLDAKLRSEQCQLNRSAEGSGLCVCCRLFGTTPKGEDEQTAGAFAGKVQISDAAVCGVKQDKQEGAKGAEYKAVSPQNYPDLLSRLVETAYMRRFHLNSPKPHHEPFYVENRHVRGRKFYHHHARDQLSRERQDIEIEAVQKDVVFSFKVDFQNLTEAELGLICLTLEMEGRCHKIGQAKPIGLGSVQIKIKSAEQLNPAQRFRNFGGALVPISNKQIAQWVQKCRDDAAVFFVDGWNALWAVYDPQAADLNPKYPSRDWFKGHGGVLLPRPSRLSDNRFDDAPPPGSRGRGGAR
ncbi:MAG: hypothetical protein DDT38_00124 [Firmicutes bacterium]|nr:hypothetical protein [candidate division NPL-UPA2 bacterium]